MDLRETSSGEAQTVVVLDEALYWCRYNALETPDKSRPVSRDTSDSEARSGLIIPGRVPSPDGAAEDCRFCRHFGG